MHIYTHILILIKQHFFPEGKYFSSKLSAEGGKKSTTGNKQSSFKCLHRFRMKGPAIFPATLLKMMHIGIFQRCNIVELTKTLQAIKNCCLQWLQASPVLKCIKMYQNEFLKQYEMSVNANSAKNDCWQCQSDRVLYNKNILR